MDTSLKDLLEAPERTPIEGARPVLAVDDEGDDDALRAAIDAAAVARVRLTRRGRDHGTWVECAPELDPRCALPRPALRRRRWQEARPVVWRGVCAGALARWRNELHDAERAGARLAEPGGLEALLRRRLGRGAAFAVERAEAGGADPERDLATVFARRTAAPDGVPYGGPNGGPNGAPVPWAKAGRLSTHPDDRSVRLRFGFGREPDDDGSADPLGHRGATGLARACLPELRLVEEQRELWSELADLAGTPLGPACPIAYWNRPQGGALFHHDAFAANETDGQRGVLFVQLAGATAWLALSTLQLARRVLSFAAQLDDAPWLVEELAPSGALEAVAEAGGDEFALVDELGAPGQGRLGALVNLGPAFTGFLADLGHAAILRPGDAIVLPNHGWRATAMHSVLCASDGPNYALSLGLRPRELVGAGRRG
jgi:hypothetical protein